MPTALISTEIFPQRTGRQSDSSMDCQGENQALLSGGQTGIRTGNTVSDGFDQEIQPAKNIIGTFTA